MPWDQALDLVLANNNLGMRREGNVIWVTTRAPDRHSIQEEEETNRGSRPREKTAESRKKGKEELAKREPIETHFITINYVEVKNIQGIMSQSTVKTQGWEDHYRRQNQDHHHDRCGLRRSRRPRDHSLRASTVPSNRS